MDVNEPGRRHQPPGIDANRRRRIAQQADSRDGVAANSDIPGKPRRAGAIHDVRAGDHDVKRPLLGRQRQTRQYQAMQKGETHWSIVLKAAAAQVRC